MCVGSRLYEYPRPFVRLTIRASLSTFEFQWFQASNRKTHSLFVEEVAENRIVENLLQHALPVDVINKMSVSDGMVRMWSKDDALPEKACLPAVLGVLPLPVCCFKKYQS